MIAIGIGIILLLGVVLWYRKRRETFTDMLMSTRPDVCSMYTNATDCLVVNSSSKNERLSGGCSWNAETGMCQVGASAEGYTSATCSQWTGCSDCNKNAACGWCAGTNKCMDRSELPTLCTGTDKAITSRADCCNQHSDCGKCANEDDCGWCKTTGKCTLGDNFGTSAGTCNPEGNYTTFASNCAAPAVPSGGGSATGSTTGGTTGGCPPRDITVAEYNTLKNRLITDLVAEIRNMRA